MVKKIVLLVLILGLLAGGFFYWRNNQADVRELNKTLPDGVRVVKSLFGNEYKVVNKIDGYSFKVPDAWKGLDIIEYLPETTEGGFTASGISMEGNAGSGRIVTINKFRIENIDRLNIQSWAENNFKTLGLVGEFNVDKIGEFDIAKTEENVHLGGAWVYFFQKASTIYALTSGSEDFIKEIILNGKW